MKTVISADPPVNQAPPEVDPARDLPRGFYDFVLPLHRAFSPRQQELAARRRGVLEAAHQGRLPDYLPASEATRGSWKVSLPGWCQDQRNQMTGPADDAELVVKMLNSGAPGVMLDLEDSVANAWPNITQGIRNIIAALQGELTFHLLRHRLAPNRRRAHHTAGAVAAAAQSSAWVLRAGSAAPRDVPLSLPHRGWRRGSCSSRGMVGLGGRRARSPRSEDARL